MQLNCPNVDCLRDFLDGSIDEAEASRISSHVVECPGCDGVLSSLESEYGDVLESLRHGVQTENLLREPEFEELRNTILVRQRDTDTTPNIDGQPTKGQRLRDYRLIKKIGEGGMGTIYQAVHVHLAKHVALKILPEDKLRSKQSVARFVSVLSSHIDGSGSVVGFFPRFGETHGTIAQPSTRPPVARATRAI